MANPTTDSIVTQIREFLDEDADDYWKRARLLEHYDNGCAAQHRIIFDAAEKTGEIRRGRNDYLRAFWKVPVVTAPTVVDQQDYAIPADMFRLDRITFGAAPETQARIVDFADDYRIKNYPQWGPTAEQPLVAFHPDNKFRFYWWGNKTVPGSVLTYTVYYWRDVARSLLLANVDVPDPFNQGPIFYAVAMALGKERTDFMTYMNLFKAQADLILPGGMAA